MRPTSFLEPVFVTAIPDTLENGKLYVSIDFATTAHLCCCGCGNEVVAPLTRTDWSLTYNGETVSLHPSIGNWSFPCQSHYWVKQGRISWAPKWSPEQIQQGRASDQFAKSQVNRPTPQPQTKEPLEKSFLSRVARWLGLR